MADGKIYADNGEIYLRVNRGREHELQIDQDILDQKDFMYPAYLTALKAVKEIIRSTDNWYIRHEARHCPQYSNDLYGFANNVIAFCGARGQGKTSSMISFANALGFSRRRSDKDRCREQEGKKSPRIDRDGLREWVGDHRFFILPPIDPTMLPDESSLIEMILTNLLDEFTRLWDRDECRPRTRADGYSPSDEEKKYDVLRLIQDCRKGIRTERGAAKTGRDPDFETFAQSNDIFKLKKNIHKIIQALFSLRGWNRKESFLVIQLDDTDMHLDNAYRITEDARKYLSLPNTVVLMATDIDQLRLTVEWYYRKTMSVPGQAPLDAFRFEYKAAKYIDKLIPVSQTAHMPTLRSQYNLGNDVRLQVVEDGEPAEDTPAADIQSVIFKQIYEKTGLAFVRHESLLHEIVPSTLRGYMHLYRLLSGMTPPDGEEKLRQYLDKDKKYQITEEYCRRRAECLKIKLTNLSEFENYFLHDWIPSRIRTRENHLAIEDLQDVAVSRLFRYAQTHLLPKKDDPAPESAQPGEKPDSDQEPARPGDYGLFLNQLDQKRRSSNSTEDFNFVFVIGTYMSIQLHKRVYSHQINQLAERETALKQGTFNQEQKDKSYVFDFSDLVEMLVGDSAEQPDSIDDLRTALRGPDFNRGLFVQGCVRLLHDPERYRQGRFESFIDCIRLQDRIVYYCCNWDMIHQIYDHVTVPDFIRKNADPNEPYLNNLCRDIWSQLRDTMEKKTEKDGAIRDSEPPFEAMPDLFSRLLPDDLDLHEDAAAGGGSEALKALLSYLEIIRNELMTDPDFYMPDNRSYLQVIYRDVSDRLADRYMAAALSDQQYDRFIRLVQSSQKAAEGGNQSAARRDMTRLLTSIRELISEANRHEADQQGT